MFSQVPVYLGRDSENRIGSAEIVDDKTITITFYRDTLVQAIEDLAELSQINGVYIDISYIRNRKATPDATA